jgi:hypothetical protein
MRRFIRIALIAGVLLAMAAGAWWAAKVMLGPASGDAAVAAVTERSPQAWIRYLLRRLEGHTKLETVFVPVLRAAQAHIEREPPAGPLPDLGKGQREQSVAPAVRGLLHTMAVDTPQAIREALLKADAGTQILVAPGLYLFRQKLRLGHDGRPDAPIALRAAQPGTVWFEFAQVEGILVDRPHWVFENLHIRGTCERHDDCEHAFHVVGRGSDVLIRNNHLSDFNAHVKVNGVDGQWPDRGRLVHNTLTNQTPRQTTKPVTPLDLVGASDWRVTDNHVTHFVKAWGNRVAFGLFMKGAGSGGRIERNLVVCTPGGISQPGVRVGISFGGGGTDTLACRADGCRQYEHRDGGAINNIVAHCNDVGLDVNRSVGILLAHNTLINTAGVSLRGGLSQARVVHNLLEGRAAARDGAQLHSEGNHALGEHLEPHLADALVLEWLDRPADAPALPGVDTDFLARPRMPVNAPGALR